MLNSHVFTFYIATTLLICLWSLNHIHYVFTYHSRIEWFISELRLSCLRSLYTFLLAPCKRKIFIWFPSAVSAVKSVFMRTLNYFRRSPWFGRSNIAWTLFSAVFIYAILCILRSQNQIWSYPDRAPYKGCLHQTTLEYWSLRAMQQHVILVPLFFQQVLLLQEGDQAHDSFFPTMLLTFKYLHLLYICLLQSRFTACIDYFKLITIPQLVFFVKH